MRMPSAAVLVIMLLAVAACGPGGRVPEDVDAPPPGIDASLIDAPGAGNLGDVGGATITPDSSYLMTDGSGNGVVILAEGGTSCVPGTATGQAVGLFFRCGAGDVGTYPVKSGGGVDCAGGPYVIVSVAGTPYFSAWARTGSVEVTVRSAAAIQGTVTASQFYNGDYPNIPGSLNGPFEAGICPAVAP
jgi:hypothetical protein